MITIIKSWQSPDWGLAPNRKIKQKGQEATKESWTLRAQEKNKNIQYEGATPLTDGAYFSIASCIITIKWTWVWRVGGGLLTILAVSLSVDWCYFFLLLFCSFPASPSSCRWMSWVVPPPQCGCSLLTQEAIAPALVEETTSPAERSQGQSFPWPR